MKIGFFGYIFPIIRQIYFIKLSKTPFEQFSVYNEVIVILKIIWENIPYLSPGGGPKWGCVLRGRGTQF